MNGPKKFRKKPVTIEVVGPIPDVQDRNMAELEEYAEWCGGTVNADGIKIETLEGDHTASPGDYILKGVKGEFYPCKPDIFEETYEPAYE